MNGDQIVQFFHKAHTRERQRLRGIEELIAALPEQDPIACASGMRKVAQFFEGEILPHNEWEEEDLYPLMDQWGEKEQLLTSALRYEHRLLERWTHELAEALETKKPDLQEFTLRAEQLVGLILAHFENEEALLPVLAPRPLDAQRDEPEKSSRAP